MKNTVTVEVPNGYSVSMSKIGEHKAKCSFCGKESSELKYLIAGPGVNICDECIVLCNDILKSYESDAAEFKSKVKEMIAGYGFDMPVVTSVFKQVIGELYVKPDKKKVKGETDGE